MVNISIDVTDLGGEARPGDKVVLWKPAAAGSSSHAGRVISTAPVDVFLTNGKATVPDVEPGDMRVLLQCRGVESQGPIDVVVPDSTGTVTLRSLIESQFEYSPPVVSAVQRAADAAADAERGAVKAQVRSEDAADRADAKVDDAINNGAELVRNEVKQDADRAVGAKNDAQAAQAAAELARDDAQTAASSTVADIHSELDGLVVTADGHASRAEAAADAAGVSETNAEQAESSAATHAQNSLTYAGQAEDARDESRLARDTAVGAAETATAQAETATDRADSAAESAAAAGESETSSAAYAQYASDAADRVGTAEQVGAWAQQAQDAADRIGTAEQVEGWADDARDSASSASTSESKAKEYRDSAATAASSAVDDARAELGGIVSDAADYATDASRSAARAKTSETNAATHEANSLSAAARAEFAAEETIQQVEGDFATRNYVDASSFVKGSLGTVGGLEGTVSGVYTVNTQQAADDLGLPKPGSVFVSRYGSANAGQALLISSGAAPEIWIAGKTSSGWQPWRRVDDPSYFKGALPSTGDKSQIESGVYYISNQTQLDYWGAPTTGTVYVSRYGSSNIGQMMLITASAPARIYVSNLLFSQGWSEFNEIGGGDSGGTTIIEGGSGAASGMKRIPLSVTLAQGSGNFARTSGTYRIPVNFNAPITRWRLHITDRNIHTGDHVGAGINIQSIFVGDRDGQTANFTNAPAQIGENIALSDAPDGEWVSAWRDEPIGDGIERMISYQYTSTSAPFAGVGAAYNTSGMVAGDITPTQWASSTPNRMAAFDIWIEAETYATTPTVAVFGDSLSCGAGATLAGYDSALNQYCRGIEALPVHFAAPGNAMQDWAGDVESYKFTRWEHLDRADAVIWAMGHNDVYRGRSFAQMRADFETLYPLVAERMAKTVFAATVTTRNEPANPDMHGVGNQWNAWLKGQIAAQSDGRIRDVFDFAAVINNGDLIRAEYDSGDKVHLNTAGYTAEANSIDRPVTTPTVVYKSTNLYEGTGSPEGKVAAPVGAVYTDSAATNGAIRWIKTSGTGNTGWRVEYGDTGWRNITASNEIIGTVGEGGAVTIRRSGDVVTFRLLGPISANDQGQFEVRNINTRFTPAMRLYLPMSTLDGEFKPQVTQYHFQLASQPAGATIVRTQGNVEFTWTTTNAWPTSLPGTPA